MPFCLSYAPQPGAQKNIFVVYPGKFTAAPIVAQKFIDELEQCLRNLRGSSYEQGTGIPTVARQKYYNHPQYILAVKNGRLIFDPLI